MPIRAQLHRCEAKEEANDYRYFPDPDLAPVVISDQWLQEIKAAMPALPKEIANQLISEYGISLTEANLLAGMLIFWPISMPGLTKVNQQKSINQLACWSCQGFIE